MARPRQPWGKWAIVLVVALQWAALVPARPAEGGPPGRGLLSVEQDRSERSREQEHQLDRLFDSTTGWSTETAEWKTLGWCVGRARLLLCNDRMEVTQLRFGKESGIKGVFPKDFFAPFRESLKKLLMFGMVNFDGRAILQQLHAAGIDKGLDTLNLSGVPINGPIPVDFEPGRSLVLSNCGLTGALPQNVYSAYYIDLSYNRLTGELMPLAGISHNIAYLDLSDNNFDGRIDGAFLFSVMDGLRIENSGNLELVGNSVDCLEIIMPNSIQIDGVDLSRWPEVSCDKTDENILHAFYNDANTIQYSNCNMTGSVPARLLARPDLHSLIIPNNNLSGEIPREGSLFLLDLANNSFSGYLSSTIFIHQNPVKCAISNNLFLCPLDPSIAAACTGTCADTCYNSGTKTERDQPCKCVGDFHGDHCEVFDMPGDGPALNCTAPGLDLELAICSPVPDHCDICQAGPALNPCPREVIQNLACVHGRCVRNEAHNLECICSDGYFGGRCDTKATYSWIYVTLGAALALTIGWTLAVCLSMLACWQRKRYRVAKAQRDTRITELEEGLLQAVELHDSMASEIDISGISVMEVLGEGGSARVFLVRWQGKPAVLKQYRDDFTYEGYVAERKVFESLRHPNIVRYWGHVEHPPCILMEYCEGGSLYDAIRSSKNVIRQSDEILMVALDIARGVSYLHGKGLVHRDIKSHNILMSRGRLKVADFDTAKRIAHEGGMTMKTGTVRWMAPEVMAGGERSGQYGRSVDIWSFACVVWEMYTHQIPYFQYEWAAEVNQAIASGETPMDKGCCCYAGATKAVGCAYYMHIPCDVEVLLRDCWAMDPAARPSIAEVVSRVEALVAEEMSEMPF